MSPSLQKNPQKRSTDPPPPPRDFIARDEEELLIETALKLALLIALAIFFQESAIELGLGSHLIKIFLSAGCVAICNGIVLRNAYPRAASVVEQAGIALVFLAFNMLLASLVPKGIV